MKSAGNEYCIDKARWAPNALTLPVLSGCSHAPEYSIFGSFFPVWIFCSVGESG
jgi:hypothetical protein